MDLNIFTLKPELQPSLPEFLIDVHLESRALSRASVELVTKDVVYHSRDCRVAELRQENVAELLKLLSEWPSDLATTSDLAAVLEKFTVVGGYTRAFEKVQLTDFLTTDLGAEWGALARTAIDSGYEDRYRLMFLFASVAFSPDANMDLLRALIGFATMSDFKRLKLPEYPSYAQFHIYEAPTVEYIAELMADAKKPYVPPQNSSEVQRGQLLLSRIAHEKESSRNCTNFAESIRGQWPKPNLNPDFLVTIENKYFDTVEALGLVQFEWTRLAQNYAFSEHLEEVQLVLNRNNGLNFGDTSAGSVADNIVKEDNIPEQPKKYPTRVRGGEIPSLQNLLQNSISRVGANSNGFPVNVALTTSSMGTDAPISGESVATTSLTAHINELRSLVASLRNSSSSVQKRYGEELEKSVKALLKHVDQPKAAHPPFNVTQLHNELARAKWLFDSRLNQMRTALAQNLPQAKWLQLGGLWPSVTPVTLLSELRSTSSVAFGKGTKSTLLELGLSITAYQHLLRIQDAALKKRSQQLEDEMANIGHQNWSPSEYPDWLLLEIEGNILLRPDQVQVAQATISPESRTNSVLQLLMGKGKTSCILRKCS
jgi:hypothetical protein